MKPMFFGEIMDDEMTKRHVWLCHDCHDGEEPTSWGPAYKVLCKECVAKRQRKIDREARRKELAEEREYARRMKEQQRIRDEKRAAEREERERKAAIEAEKQRLIDIENAKRKRKSDRNARALKRQRRYDPPGTVYEEDKPKPKPKPKPNQNLNLVQRLANFTVEPLRQITAEPLRQFTGQARLNLLDGDRCSYLIENTTINVGPKCKGLKYQTTCCQVICRIRITAMTHSRNA